MKHSIQCLLSNLEQKDALCHEVLSNNALISRSILYSNCMYTITPHIVKIKQVKQPLSCRHENIEKILLFNCIFIHSYERHTR